ncbi:hypothetical protein BDW62DRAFT_206232 [Aspergillus aurantiobrunneus]
MADKIPFQNRPYADPPRPWLSAEEISHEASSAVSRLRTAEEREAMQEPLDRETLERLERYKDEQAHNRRSANLLAVANVDSEERNVKWLLSAYRDGYETRLAQIDNHSIHRDSWTTLSEREVVHLLEALPSVCRPLRSLKRGGYSDVEHSGNLPTPRTSHLPTARKVVAPDCVSVGSAKEIGISFNLRRRCPQQRDASA